MIGATIFLLILITIVTKMVVDVQKYKKTKKQDEYSKLFDEEQIYHD